jgi:signal transduction histidine kinase
MLGGSGFAVLTVLLGGATYYFANKSLVDELDTRIAVETRSLMVAAEPNGVQGVAVAVRRREAQPSVGNLGYMVLDAHGRRIAGSLNAKVPPAGYWDCMDYVGPDGGPSVAQSLNSAIPGGGLLVVAVDRSIVDRADDMILILFGSALAFILLFGFSAAWLLGRIVRARLARIAATADAIMAGDLSRRMPIDHSHGEFDQLSAAFNTMLDRIEVLLENLRRLSIGVAHDIRSPLNRARSRLEAAERSLEGLPQQHEVTASIEDVDEVLDLLRALLGISEVEGFAVRARFTRLDLGTLVEDVVDGYRPVVESAGMTIAAVTALAAISGDAALLRRSLANLIDNAILYTPPGTQIVVTVERRGEMVKLIVHDDGPGVPATEREAIFGRFVRLDSSRSQPGHGLGLNLVGAIANAHHGKARALPVSRGLAIEISIPADPSVAAQPLTALGALTG